MEHSADQRHRWIEYYHECGNKMRVCRRYHITRPTLDKWLKRWQRGTGEGRLESRSRRPKRCRDMLTAREQALIRMLIGQKSKPARGFKQNPNLLGIPTKEKSVKLPKGSKVRKTVRYLPTKKMLSRDPTEPATWELGMPVRCGDKRWTPPMESSIDYFRTGYGQRTPSEVRRLLRDEAFVYGWTRRPPSLHAIRNAIERRGHRVIRRNNI